MKKIFYFIICFAIFNQSIKGQTTSKKEIYIKDFDWTITIPENFEAVSAEEWTKIQNKGAEAIEKTIDEKVENRAKTIFVFKSDQLNFFESNYQPFDTVTDGDYSASCKNVNEMVYQTFVTQIQDIKIDTATSIEKIDNLEFHTFKIVIIYPNNQVMNVFMFSRLFDKKEFTVNIMYLDNKKGELMLDSWRNSKFGNK